MFTTAIEVLAVLGLLCLIIVVNWREQQHLARLRASACCPDCKVPYGPEGTREVIIFDGPCRRVFIFQCPQCRQTRNLVPNPSFTAWLPAPDIETRNHP